MAMVAFLAACVNLGGCVAIYTHDTVHTSVRDAETDVPIANATVQVISLRTYWCINPPSDVTVQTDNNGAASPRVANWDNQEWDVAADGYLPDQRCIFDDHARQRIDFRLVRGPKPHVTIIVPDGYRGLVKIDWHHVPTEPPEGIGTREFTYRMSPTGHVRINVTPVLNVVNDYEIEMAYENGKPIEHFDWVSGPDDSVDRLGFILVASVNEHWVYIVGMKQEMNNLYARIYGPSGYSEGRIEELFNEPSSQTVTGLPKSP